jgi:glycerol-3-phosphate dehydrogenase
VRNRKVNEALIQGVETARAVLETTPQGQAADAQFVKWLMEHQKEAGVFTTVSTLVDQLCDNPAAKLTAQEIVERLQRAQQARPVTATAPSAPTPAPGCPSGNCVATVPAV